MFMQTKVAKKVNSIESEAKKSHTAGNENLLLCVRTFKDFENFAKIVEASVEADDLKGQLIVSMLVISANLVQLSQNKIERRR